MQRLVRLIDYQARQLSEDGISQYQWFCRPKQWLLEYFETEPWKEAIFTHDVSFHDLCTRQGNCLW